MTSTKAVGPGSRIGDTAGIEAQKLVVLLALSHSLEPTPKLLNECDTRAARPSRIEDDSPAEGRVIRWDCGAEGGNGDGDSLGVVGILPI